ncbi:MAG: hypothetical protein IJV15_01450 [Lachnospiraceae bacterium]|nr:hypothetical protein [Lachnospiraceae bacterium]
MDNNFNWNNQDNNQQIYGQQQGYNQQTVYQQNILTRKEFLNLPQMQSIKSSISSTVVMIYVCVALNIVLIIAGLSSLVALFDVAIMLVSAIGIQRTYSNLFGIIMLVYSIINVLVFLVVAGRLGGYLILAAGILGFVSTSKFNKAYNEYISSGKIPNYYIK